VGAKQILIEGKILTRESRMKFVSMDTYRVSQHTSSLAH